MVLCPSPARPVSDRVRELTRKLGEQGVEEVPGSAPRRKMSDMILDLANAEIEYCLEVEREDRIEGVVGVAVLGWNASVAGEVRGGTVEGHIQRMLVKSTFEPGVRADIYAMARRLAIRKQWLYPDVHRFIFDFYFRQTGDGCRLEVCSVVSG